MRFSLANSPNTHIEVNLVAGLIIKDGQEHKIRAKTLLVLKYLISHNTTVVTKQSLLNDIWHDVIVQEQVLVQSIKEIRDLLGSNVIKTYPRKGYQWVADINEIPTTKLSKKIRLSRIIAIACFTLLLMTAAFYYFFNTKAVSPENMSVAFLPVKNDMPDDIHDWVPLAGMDYLTQRLQQQSQLTLVNKSQVLSLLAHKNTTEAKSDIAAMLQKKLGADLIVQTRLLGYPQDFQLHYTLFLPHSIERGIEFADTIDKTFEQLVQKIAVRFDQYTPKTTTLYTSDFSNEAFTRGIEHYLQRQYTQAINFFNSALQSNNEFLAARRYLAASYINNGDTEKGIALMKENIDHAQLKQDHREEIRSNLMVGVLLINRYETNPDDNKTLAEALHYINKTKVLAEQYHDLLFSAYAYEELAKIKRLQQQYSQAIVLLNKALKLHQTFRGDYGQTRPLIELALVANAQGNDTLANNYFDQATIIANKNGVTTNKVAILLAQAQTHQQQGAMASATEIAHQALYIAQQANSNILVARVEAWLANNSRYEIN